MLVTACEQPEQRAVNLNRTDTLREPLILENREWTGTEEQLIDAYIERQNLTVNKSGTGLRYKIYHEGTGIQAREGMTAEIRYNISLLNGKLVYRTPPGRTEKFLIGMDDVESGLHEGIRYLRVGDKAILIMPSHRAYGLTGDMSRIPPRASLVFDIELVGLE